jgi:hypothetical protein
MVIDPFQGDAFFLGMLELAEKLYISGAEVNKTCALHTHVGGSDLSYWEIRRLLRVYAQIESEIYDYLILPYRRDDPTVVHYCQMLTRPHAPCDRCERFDSQYPGARTPYRSIQRTMIELEAAKSTAELKAGVLKMLYNLPDATKRFEEFQTRKGGRYEWCRYVGMNLHAWQYRGTIEFRMKEATTDLEELIAWPMWCGWFVHAVTTMKEKDSFGPIGLVEFTERYMPKWITRWVHKKVEERKSRI